MQLQADHTVAFGGSYLVHPSRHLGTARVRAFRELALDSLRTRPGLHTKPRKSAPPPQKKARARRPILEGGRSGHHPRP